MRDAVTRCRRNLQAQLDAIRPSGDGDAAAVAPATIAAVTIAATAADPETSAPLANTLEDALAELDEREEELALCENHIDLYSRHLLRKALSSTITRGLLEELKGDSTRVHLVSDYKQKVLPESSRETQTMAFGKRGKSLHGTTALRWNPKSEDFDVINRQRLSTKPPGFSPQFCGGTRGA